MNLQNLLLFLSITLMATITPGPAIMLVSVNSIRYGIKNSVWTIMGNISGLFIMSLLAVLGLSTIILYSAPVFISVKIIGALYLIYLGFKLWSQGFNSAIKNPQSSGKNLVTPLPRKLFFQGLLIALSNPKAIAFTTALFPQFIDSTQPLTMQFLILVSIFMLLSFSSLLGYAMLANKAQKQSVSKHGLQSIVGKLFGSIFIGSGIALAFVSQK